MVPTATTALATTRVGDLHREAQVSPWTRLVMDRRQDGDHTHPHDNAHPKVPDLRRPARPRPAFAPVTWRAAHTMDDP